MKLTTPREPFQQHLQFAAAICPTRSTRPILKDCLLEVDGDSISITASDGEVSVRRRFTAEGVSGEGRAALPSSTLLSASRSLDGDTIELVEKDHTHEVTCGSAYFRLNSDDPELFPALPTLDRERGVDVPLQAFVDLCQRTMFAAAKDMGRYAFNGVLLEIDPQEVTLVATDGRRLSLAKMEMATEVGERLSAIVPLKGLQQLQRAAGDADIPLRIEMRETMVAFLLPDTEIQALLVEGDFPDFRAVLPQEADVPHLAAISKDAFASAIQRASITAGDEGPSVELAFGKGSLQILSRQEGLGESRSDLQVNYQGDDVGIRFNPTFLGEYLKTLPDGEVTFHFKDRSSAGLFTFGEDALYVVMPITS